jgi:hypothetical protein
MLLAALLYKAEGLDLTLLFTVKMRRTLIDLVRTRILTASMIEWQFILSLKH